MDMDNLQKEIARLSDTYDFKTPRWSVELNKLIIACSINQSNCINEQHREDNVRLSGVNILYNILNAGGRSTQKELSESMSITKQALTLAVNSLERHGFVTRTWEPSDRRIRYIQLTEEGIQFLERSANGRRDFLNAICEVITESEARQVIDVLGRINDFYKDYLDVL